MPFRKSVGVYSPELLAAMTAAYDAALKSSSAPLTEADKVLMKDRILASAASGVEDVAGLTRVALLTKHSA